MTLLQWRFQCVCVTSSEMKTGRNIEQNSAYNSTKRDAGMGFTVIEDA